MKIKLLQINKKQWLTMSLITLVVAIFRIILQLFIPSSGTSTLEPSGTSTLQPSVIVKAGLLPLAFLIFAIVLYGLLAILFFVIQDKLPGTGMKKGMVFGFSFCMMWFIYMLEPVPYVFEQALIEFLLYPIVDGAAFLLLGFLLGKFIATDTQSSRKVSVSNNIVTVVSISLVFLLGRYFCYSVLHMYSSFTTKPLLTMAWTEATGICIGIMYLLLSPAITVESSLLKAVYFGILVIGIDLFLFNCFMILVFDSSIVVPFIRTIIDVVPITVGVYVAEKARSIFNVKQSYLNQ